MCLNLDRITLQEIASWFFKKRKIPGWSDPPRPAANCVCVSVCVCVCAIFNLQYFCFPEPIMPVALRLVSSPCNQRPWKQEVPTAKEKEKKKKRKGRKTPTWLILQWSCQDAKKWHQLLTPTTFTSHLHIVNSSRNSFSFFYSSSAATFQRTCWRPGKWWSEDELVAIIHSKMTTALLTSRSGLSVCVYVCVFVCVCVCFSFLMILWI